MFATLRTAGVAVAVAGAGWLGALHPRAVPLSLVVAVWVLVVVTRRRAALVLAVLVLAASLSHAAWQGIEPVERGDFAGQVTLVADPVRGRGGQVRVDVRLPDGSRVEAVGVRGAGGLLAARAAGERVDVVARLEPPPPDAPWLVPRHVRGRLRVDAVEGWSSGHLLSRAANTLRRTLSNGARTLDADHAALYTGLVLGDDREQSAEDADAFRGSGLGHLLAVSGQNVAFVLLVVQPLAHRLPSRARTGVLLLALMVFACVTRFEPSVLRAVTMAGIAVLASGAGRPTAGLQLLALAVAILVLVDPLLVHAMAFRLSVAASAGILLLAPMLRVHVPGPSVLAEALSVTVAAQLAVAPLVVPAFGGIPVVSIPANVLAGPATGPVTAWGLTGGLLAGVVPDVIAGVLQVPNVVLLWWIDGVAHVAVRLALGDLGGRHVLAIVVLGLLVLGARQRGSRVGALVGVVALVAVLAHPAVALRTTPPTVTSLGEGVELWRDGGVVLVLDGRARDQDVLAGLRRAGVRRLDLVVARTPGAARTISAVTERHRGATVLGPGGVGDPVRRPTTVRVGAVVVDLAPQGDRLEVTRVPPDEDVTTVR